MKSRSNPNRPTPTRRPKPSARIARASGRKSHARRGRKSSGRWKSGLANSRNGSSSKRGALASSRSGADGRAAWPGSSRPPCRRDLNVKGPKARVRHRPMSRVAVDGEVAAVTAPSPPVRRARRHRPGRGRARRNRGRLVASDRRARRGHPDRHGAATGGRGVPTPHPPPQGGRETSLVLLPGGRGRSPVLPPEGKEMCPVRRPGARANSRDGGVGAVVAAAAAHGRADRLTQGARRIPAVTRARADIARGSEFAGIEWTGGALA
jgi:hypothetical protein